ncbi:MAG: hypothetical protein ACYC9R_12750 [Nitrosotalea sp.]
MKFKAPGHKIVIKLDSLEEEEAIKKEYSELAKSNFTVVKPDGQDKRERLGTDTGVVLQIGPMAWKAIDGDKSGWEPWCKVGDRVVFGRYAGKLVVLPNSKEEIYVINDEDIQLVLEEG